MAARITNDHLIAQMPRSDVAIVGVYYAMRMAVAIVVAVIVLVMAMSLRAEAQPVENFRNHASTSTDIC